MPGEIEGCGIVDRQLERLPGLEARMQGADQAAEKIVRPAVRQPVAHDRGERLPQEIAARPRPPAAPAPRHQRQAEQSL